MFSAIKLYSGYFDLPIWAYNSWILFWGKLGCLSQGWFSRSSLWNRACQILQTLGDSTVFRQSMMYHSKSLSFLLCANDYMYYLAYFFLMWVYCFVTCIALLSCCLHVHSEKRAHCQKKKTKEEGNMAPEEHLDNAIFTLEILKADHQFWSLAEQYSSEICVCGTSFWKFYIKIHNWVCNGKV